MSTIPPTQPAMLTVPKPQSTWPTVVGIITIIIGALGIVQYMVCAPIGWAMMGFFQAFLDQAAQAQPGVGLEAQAAHLEAMRPYMAGNIAVNCASGLLAIMLLIGGIALVRRRPSASRTLVAWAVLRIVQAVPAVLVGYFMQMAMFEAMEEATTSSGGGPGAPPPGLFSIMAAFGIVGLVIGLLIAWALPAFVLIWFARSRIRAEVAEWRRPNEYG